jgi:Spy/CpxP family protein refolding chaperone
MLGASAVYIPSVQSKLALSAPQKQQIEAIRLEGVSYVGKINHQFEDGKIGFHDRIKLLHDRRMAQGASLMKVLTPEQRAALLTLEGKKFSFQV